MKYWLIDHPTIVWFRWSPSQSWGSTWPFLVTAIATYITAALTLHVILNIFKRHRAVPLGPIPAIHYLIMSLISATIFTGILFSAAAELRDTRWLLRRTKTTPFEWFLCFPLGIRPSGRVFFWSYAFYLSRFLHLFRTFFVILRHRKLSFFRLFNNSILLLSSFLWLEFSQSFQVLGILFSTLVYCLVYGFRFWIEIGLPSGCNGFGAWIFNSVLNAAILFLFLKSYVNVHCQKKKNSTASSTCDEASIALMSWFKSRPQNQLKLGLVK
ncbi:elongation of fatty acids protein 1-like [Trifolium pratense]|uniref:Elongation of fatty acids protein 1-like n=1 Tax=Trifolium pratense TaxID=57577 RepID=A0A2K3NH61_TRIPR|nr:elongation of fatty acids protein 1-like [Trifolium pratense]